MELLDVYYYVALNSDQDIDFIEKYLQIYLNTKVSNYKINFIKRFDESQILEEKDVIKNGINVFNEMFEKLKLKGKNDVWFIYINNGNIKDIYKNIFVILLNNDPKEKRCRYVINKNSIDLPKVLDKYKKLEILKTFGKSLDQLMTNDKNVIKY
jgi:hypothetical protein